MNTVQSKREMLPLSVGAVAPTRSAIAPQDVVATFFARPLLMALAFLVPLLGGALACYVVPPTWTANGLLIFQVSRETLAAVDPTGEGPTVVSVETPKIVQSEVDLFLSDAVLGRALAIVGPVALFPELASRRLFGLLPPVPQSEWFALGLRRLHKAINAATSQISNTVRITATMPDRDRSVLALKAALQAYQTHRMSIFVQDDSALLAGETARIEGQLQELDAKIAQVRSEATVLDYDRDVQSAAARMESVQSRIDALRERQAATEAELDAARKQAAAYPGAGPEAPRAADADGAGAAAGRARSGLSDQLSRLRPEYTHIAQVEVEAAAMARQMAELASQKSQAEARASQLVATDTVLRHLERRRDALDSFYRQMTSRETGLRISEEASRAHSGTVVVGQQPTPAQRPSDLRLSLLVAGFGAGLLTTGAASVLLTLLRRTFLTPDEATRGLGVPALAALPRPRKKSGYAGLPQVAELASMLADCLAEREGGSIVQLVACDDAADAGLLAGALAQEFAGGWKRRTVLLDLRSDAPLPAFALPAPGDARPGEPLNLRFLDTSIPGLAVVSRAGEHMLAPRQLSKNGVAVLIEQVRGSVNIAIVVCPTPLGNYGVRRLMPLVDINVLVIAADRTRRGDASAVRDLVQAAEGRLDGFVMSRARPVPPRFVQRLFA